MSTTDKTYLPLLPSLERREDIVTAVLGSAFERWGWWKDVQYANGYSWHQHPVSITQPFVTVTAEDPESDGDIVRDLTVEDIVRGFLYANIAVDKDADDIDLDADTGDVVMQEAVYGDYIFA